MGVSLKKNHHFLRRAFEVSSGCMSNATSNLPLKNGGKLIDAISLSWFFLLPLSPQEIFSSDALKVVLISQV